jgi:hypothetical protein
LSSCYILVAMLVSISLIEAIQNSNLSQLYLLSIIYHKKGLTLLKSVACVRVNLLYYANELWYHSPHLLIFHYSINNVIWKQNFDIVYQHCVYIVYKYIILSPVTIYYKQKTTF